MPKIVDHEQQRRELSATVVEVVLQLGLENTSLRTVAEHHGCTKGMVQHYFSDKEQLLQAALAHLESEAEVRIADAVGELKGLAGLEARLRAQLPLLTAIRHEWQVRLAFASRALLAQGMQSTQQKYTAAQQSAAMAQLRTARKMGELASGLDLAYSHRLLTAVVYGIAVAEVMSDGGLSAAKQRALLKNALDSLRR